MVSKKRYGTKKTKSRVRNKKSTRRYKKRVRDNNISSFKVDFMEEVLLNEFL